MDRTTPSLTSRYSPILLAFLLLITSSLACDVPKSFFSVFQSETFRLSREKERLEEMYDAEIVDDEDVGEFSSGDIIWVPRKPDRDWWEVFRQTIAVAAQVATVYLVVDRALE